MPLTTKHQRFSVNFGFVHLCECRHYLTKIKNQTKRLINEFSTIKTKVLQEMPFRTYLLLSKYHAWPLCEEERPLRSPMMTRVWNSLQYIIYHSNSKWDVRKRVYTFVMLMSDYGKNNLYSFVYCSGLVLWLLVVSTCDERTLVYLPAMTALPQH